MRIVYSTTDGVVAHAGLRLKLSHGDVWDAEDSLVVARPDLFSDTPRFARRTDGIVALERTDAGGIEEATARPASKRIGRAGKPVSKSAGRTRA